MKIEFKDQDLESMAYDADYTGKWSIGAIKGYRKVITIIIAAKDRRDFYNFRSLRMEKLKGDKKDLHSMRIYKQFRLIMSIDPLEGSKEEVVTILSVEDYH